MRGNAGGDPRRGLKNALKRAVPVAEAGIGRELGGAHRLLEVEKAEEACHELLIRRVDAGDAEIPEFLLVAVPGEEQMAIGRGAMEDEAVRIHRKTGGAELWKIVE